MGTIGEIYRLNVMPKKKWTDKETFYVLIAIGFAFWMIQSRTNYDPCPSNPSHPGCLQIPPAKTAI
jgi:hypothetical protein